MIQSWPFSGQNTCYGGFSDFVKMLLASEWISFYQGPLFLNVCLYSRVPPPSRLYLVNYLQNDPDKSAPYWPDRYDHCSAPNMITLIAPRSSVYVSVGLK